MSAVRLPEADFRNISFCCCLGERRCARGTMSACSASALRTPAPFRRGAKAICRNKVVWYNAPAEVVWYNAEAQPGQDRSKFEKYPEGNGHLLFQ
jgi:hypothetical protein